MATSVRSNGRQVRHQPEIRHRVGQFFEQNATQLIGGELNREDDLRLGDIVNWDLRLGVEVKSSNNKRPMEIPIGQKNGHYSMLPFPLEQFAYLLCCYRGQKRGRGNFKRFTGIKSKTFSALARFTKRVEQHKMLAEIISDHFLLDIEIINALEREIGTVPSKQPPRTGEPELRILRNHLYAFKRKSYSKMMKSLGLNLKDWSYAEYHITHVVALRDTDYLGLGGDLPFNYHPVTFTLYTVLSNVINPHDEPSQSFNDKFTAHMIGRGYTPST